MTLTDKIKNSILILDGAMGTELQKRGLGRGELPEERCITHPDDITAIHRAYLDAGSDVVYANTFGANCIKFGDRTEEVVRAAVECARAAVAGRKDKYVALDVGPTGRLLAPLGDLSFEDAVSVFRRTVAAGVAAGVDLIVVETMNDCYELKAAVVAAKEVCELPIFATMVFDKDAKTMTGCSPEAMTALLEGLGVTALGINCSLAPADMADTVKRVLAVASVPVIVKPNAGLPVERAGDTVYSLGAADFAADMRELVRAGARIVGGCCGTTPEYIKSLKTACRGLKPIPVTDKARTVVSSYTKALDFGADPVLIGERINPTGKKRLKQALRDNDIAYVLNEAVTQTEAGVHALDVNVGLPEIDEPEMLARAVFEIQAVTDLPLQIDTSDPVAMERAMRVYNGKPLVNSVNGKPESMAAVFPLVKKYGGCVICLTLDGDGIPATARGRADIAHRIVKAAAGYGISKNDLIFDTLATAVSADVNAANVSIEAIRLISAELGCKTSLGISNISYGLPQRDVLTSTYFALALGAGLSAAICNPFSTEILKVYRSYMALTARDKSCEEYIGFASGLTAAVATPQAAAAPHAAAVAADGLKYAVIKGLKTDAAEITGTLIKERAPLDIINAELIPALDEVGKGYEAKRVFLPQLLMSAEAATAAFDVIKGSMSGSGPAKRTSIVLATVRGDIHDIGKNIVATLLSNYGFTVTDLGRDVPPEAVLAAVKRTNADIVGLSALMTTTVVSMRETVALIKRECPGVKTCVGGAVLNAEYAAMMGADRYCKDAMETVRYAEAIEAEKYGR